jgi:hypothetical protein
MPDFPKGLEMYVTAKATPEFVPTYNEAFAYNAILRDTPNASFCWACLSAGWLAPVTHTVRTLTVWDAAGDDVSTRESNVCEQHAAEEAASFFMIGK